MQMQLIQAEKIPGLGQLLPGISHEIHNPIIGKGTGLGLAIARQIVVEKHGGAIELNSVLREGTEFAIVLPLNNQREQDELLPIR